MSGKSTYRTFIGAMFWMSFASAHAVAENYTFTSLTNADGRAIYPTALNSQDQVVGGGYLNEGPGSAVSHAFLWSKGVVSQIDFGENANNGPTGINDKGLVIGTYQAGPGEVALAFTYDTVSGTTRALTDNSKLSVRGLGINAAGTAVGGVSPYPQKSPPRGKGFVAAAAGKFHTFSPAPMSVAEALAINDSGTIMGVYQLPSNPYQTLGYVGQDSKFTTILVPGAMTIYPAFINNDGTVGGSYIDPNNHVRGFIYRSGMYTTIDYPDAISTFVVGVLSDGRVFGNVQRQGGTIGFIETNGKYSDIRLPGYQQTTIIAVNIHGDFVGSGKSTQHRGASFLAQCRAANGRCN